MAGKTLTRADLSEAVHRHVGLSRTESADLVKSVLDIMTDTLITGETVKLSSFGTFMVRSKSGASDAIRRRARRCRLHRGASWSSAQVRL